MFRIAYQFCVSVTGSFGFSLVMLSLLVACVYVPLHRVVNRSRDREQEVQDVMAPQMAEIKTRYKGSERHEAIIRLYRRYGYHPIMAIRSAFGILLQVPFLMAAYYMVAHMTTLQGESFLFIKDLSLPDGLLSGVNLLPIVMTVLNVITAFITPKMKMRERAQALLLAGLFLWLLYPAPSALLFYWTCNNAIYVAEALFAIRSEGGKVKKKSQKPSQPCHIYSWKQSFWGRDFALNECQAKGLAGLLNMAVVTLFLAYFFSSNGIFYLLSQATISDSTVFAITSHLYRLVSFIVCLVAIVSLKNLLLSGHEGLTNRGAATRLVSIIVFTVFVLIFGENRFVENSIPEVDQGIFTAFLWAPLIFSLVSYALCHTGREMNACVQGNFKSPGGIYFASVFAFAAIYYALLPSKLYLSEPAFFASGFGAYMANLLPCFIAFCVFFSVLWLKLPKGSRSWLATLALTIVTFSTFVCFIFTVDYGALDGAVFKVPQKLLRVETLRADILSVFCTFCLVWLLCHYKRLQKFIVYYLVGVSIFSFGYASYVCTLPNANEEKNNLQQARSKEDLLPPYHRQLWKLSKSEKNVIVILFDEFTGSDINQLMKIEPNLKSRLDGFVWYPDTISAGESTYISTPAVYGGNAFTPQKIDEMGSDEDLYTKVNKAYYLLANSFGEAGYNVALVGLPYSSVEQQKRNLKVANALTLLHTDLDGDYVPYWKRVMGQEGRGEASSSVFTSYFTTLSAFCVMPHTFRAKFYDDGEWCDNMEGIAIAGKDTVLARVAAMQFMADFVTMTSKKPTFKFIYSCLTHPPYCLAPKSTIPVEEPEEGMEPKKWAEFGLNPSHAFSELHALRFVANLCDRLKKEGAYDNTRIIIVSDHCGDDSIMLREAFGIDCKAILDEMRQTGFQKQKIKHRMNLNIIHQERSLPNSPHAIMLVKDFKSKGELSRRDSLVTNGDTASFATNGLLKISGIPTGQEFQKLLADKSRHRVHAVSSDSNPKSNKRSSYNYSEIYEVTGTMFKKENWKKVK